MINSREPDFGILVDKYIIFCVTEDSRIFNSGGGDGGGSGGSSCIYNSDEHNIVLFTVISWIPQTCTTLVCYLLDLLNCI